MLAAVLEREVDWAALPDDTPAVLRSLLRRCLQKDRDRRLHDIADARIELEDLAREVDGGPRPEPAAAAKPRRSRLAVLAPRGTRERVWMAVSTVVLLAALAVTLVHFRERGEDVRSIRFPVHPPEDAAFGPFALSPDGRRLAFVAHAAGERTVLWVRSLESLVSQPLPGTEGANYPFWSPDSRFVGFFADGKLKKIAISGGLPRTVCEAVFGHGGSWNRDGVIIFVPGLTERSGRTPVHRVSAAGGEAEPVIALDPSRGEISQRWPQFLPDGRHFLFFSLARRDAGIYVGSLDSKDTRLLLRTRLMAIYAPPGYLLFSRDGRLMARRFDADELAFAGEAFPIAEGVGQMAGQFGLTRYVGLSASDDGVVAYHPSGGQKQAQLTWFDRQGEPLEVVGEPARYRDPALSPDEEHVAVELCEYERGTHDFWLIELSRGVMSRLTADSADKGAALWSPDGSRIVFSSDQEGQDDLYQRSLSGAGQEELVLKSSKPKIPLDWSPDGRFLVYAELSGAKPGGHWDLWVLPLFGEGRPVPFLQTKSDKFQTQLSPDGQWIAYSSDESGRFEVYVKPFPDPGGRWRISTAGGVQPRWRADGKELFYLEPVNAEATGLEEPVRVMVVAIETDSSTLEASLPGALFQTRLGLWGPLDVRSHYLVTADGQRLLFVTPVEEPTAPIVVVVDWSQGLERLAPTGERDGGRPLN
jgi:Tol biopolymer transport system component